MVNVFDWLQRSVVILMVVLLYYMYSLLNRSYLDLYDNYTLDKPLKPPLNSTFLRINGKIKRLGNIEQIYVINLPSRQDRRRGSIALFQALDWNVFLVPGYTINSPEVIAHTHLTRQGRIRLIEIACWASHFQLWLEIANFKHDRWILIFEDDIDLESSIFDILESLHSYIWTVPDLIYLGHCGNPPGLLIYKTIQNYRIHQATNPSCTHAYAIRSHSAQKLINLLSSPLKAIDDTIVDLANNKQILVYSIHPPLAIQQSNTSLFPSDINPVRNTIGYKIKKWFNFLVEKWKGVEFIDKLNNSTLIYANFQKADQWRRMYETDLWKI